MIEQLMSSSLSGDHQGCVAGFISLHVRGLRSLIAAEVVAAADCAGALVAQPLLPALRDEGAVLSVPLTLHSNRAGFQAAP